MNTPIDRTLVDKLIADLGIADFSRATIREVKAVAAQAEAASGVEFIKMEMGVPGLPPSAVGVEAEVEALRRGVASLYPDINGESMLKAEASRFVKAFVDVDISPEGCVPVTGSMQGTFASFLTCTQCQPERDTVLFIDPGFPVQKQQLVVMGARAESFDVYDYRGGTSRPSYTPVPTILRGSACAKMSWKPSDVWPPAMRFPFWKIWLTSQWTSVVTWDVLSSLPISLLWHVIRTCISCSSPVLRHSAMPGNVLVWRASPTNSIIVPSLASRPVTVLPGHSVLSSSIACSMHFHRARGIPPNMPWRR